MANAGLVLSRGDIGGRKNLPSKVPASMYHWVAGNNESANVSARKKLFA
jgi:hypothetical protein